MQPSIENEEDASVDMALYLRLQPMVLNSESERSTYPPAPPPPSPASFISMDPPNSRDLSEIDSVDSIPSLVLIGCTDCYFYVMVSEADPKCPKCGTYDLLDQFRGNSGMCKRKN